MNEGPGMVGEGQGADRAGVEIKDQARAKDKLLDTAAAIMRDNDSDDVSLSELSLRSGLNSALVKYYFGNKAGLLRALLDREMAEIVHSLQALVGKDMDPAARLERHVGAMVDRLYDAPYLNRLLMKLVRESDAGEAQRIADTYLTPLGEAYERLIREGVEKGEFRDVDPQLFYFTVTGAVDRFFSARLVLRHCYDRDTLTEELRDAYREHVTRFVMAGLAADDG